MKLIQLRLLGFVILLAGAGLFVGIPGSPGNSPIKIFSWLDPVNTNPASALASPLLQNPQTLTVQIGERQVTIRSSASSIGLALAEAGLPLQGLDYSQPAAESPLPANGKIRLVRVQEVVSIEQEPLKFDTELQPAPDLELDKRKVVRAGVPGLQAQRIRARYEDGKLIARQVEEQWVLREPLKQILGYGTQIVLRTLNTSSGPIQYWRTVQMYATSYSPCRIYKDHCDSYTALGATLQRGIVAMTNAWCRYTCGDKVYVPGYGVGTVADTGGGIPGRYWIDLGYSDNDYVQWNQTVTVYFLAPVPSNYQVVLP